MKTLGLFFTYGVSLQQWKKNGSFNREIAIYNRFLAEFDRIFFYTYGTTDVALQKSLPVGITVIPKWPRWMPDWLYSLLLPIIHARHIQNCTWLKTNQMIGSWAAVLSANLFRKRLVVRTGYTASLFAAHEAWWRRSLIYFIEWLALRRANQILVTTVTDKAYLTRRYRLPEDRCLVIPNGVDTSLFVPAVKKIYSPPVELLFVGRLIPQKNILALLEAVTTCTNVHLTVVGDGPWRPALLEKKSPTLRYIPAVPNDQLPAYYQIADIYLQPSLYEGNPKSILEAMSCAVPVIATDVPGIREVIVHQKTGYLCHPDSASIRQAIETLAADRAWRVNLGQAARRYVVRQYDLSSVVATELSVYRR